MPEETTEETDFEGTEDSDDDDGPPATLLADLLRAKIESLPEG